MKPIQKKLLVNQVSYKKRKENNGEGITYETPTTLEYVRIEDNKKYNYSQNGKELISNAILFYDLVNSTGLEKEPTIDSKIIFEDKEYKVIDVTIERDERTRPHHYELVLK